MSTVDTVHTQGGVEQMENNGKLWEGVVRETLVGVYGVSLDRLPDPMMGYKGIRNICDFIVYRIPYQFYVECKTVKGNTFPLGNITQNQWDGLLEKSKISGVKGIVLLWFSEHDTVVALSIEYLDGLRRSGYKSFNIKTTFEEPRGFKVIPCRVPRVKPKMDGEQLLDLMAKIDK